MSQDTIQDVAPATNTENTDKPKAETKPNFDFSTATDADGNAIPLSSEGRLTAVPHNWTSKSAHLKVGDFAVLQDAEGNPRPGTDRGNYIGWRILQTERQRKSIDQRLEVLRDEQRAAIDPTYVSTAKVSSQLRNAMNQAAKLKEQLLEQGMTEEAIAAFLNS